MSCTHVRNRSYLVPNSVDAVTNGRRTISMMMRMKKHPMTNRHFDICFIVQSTLIFAILKFRHFDICNISILFIFIYGCIMHIATYF